MNDTKDGGHPRREFPEDGTERIVKLLRRFFHVHFCPAEDVPQNRKPDIEPTFFCGWLDKHMGEYVAEDECKEAGVPESTWVAVRTILDKGTAPEALYSVWYAIVLSDRPQPKNAVRDVNVVVNVTYGDGTIATTQAYVNRDMMLDGPEFNDAVLFSMLRANLRNVLAQMVSQGLDAMHDRAAADGAFTHPTQDPYEFMMGFVLKFLLKGEPFPLNPQGGPAALKLEPGLHKAVHTYYRMAQQFIRPVLPPGAIEAMKRRQAQLSGEEKGKPVGGWDA